MLSSCPLAVSHHAFHMPNTFWLLDHWQLAKASALHSSRCCHPIGRLRAAAVACCYVHAATLLLFLLLLLHSA
jgi:hypothetical protein